MRWFAFGSMWVWFCCGAAQAGGADGKMFAFRGGSSEAAVVRVDVGRRADRPASRLLYGKFTEHLGRNIYWGMWAQLLVNPGMEASSWWGSRAGRVGRELAFRLDAIELAEAADRGLPPGWIAASGPGVSCQPDRQPRTGQQCLRLEASRPESVARVGQPVWLPLFRQTAYDWSLYVKAEQDARFTVRLRARSDERLRAEQSVQAPAGPWKKYQGRLELPGPRSDGPAAFQWEIELPGPATLRIDQCCLFPADHQDGWDPDVVRMVKDSRLPLLRWPGGNFASGYHWKDGIGPVEDRPIRLNRPWNMPEPNHVGTDEFMRFCQLVEAEPMICVNAGDGTPEEAADWVEYCNGPADSPMGRLRAANGHPAPYGVRYWEVGNELYGRWQIGHCTAEEYARRYDRFVRAMRARDPAIRLIANGHDARWNDVLIRQCSEPLERLSVHTLIGGGMPPSSDPEAVWWLVVGYPWAYQDQLGRLATALRQRTPEGTLAITELQIFTNRPNLPNNGGLAEALFWAGVVHTAIRAGDRVELITHSALVNHGGGLRKLRQAVFGNPVYWARRMYSTQPGRWPVAVQLEGPAFSAPPLHNLPGLKDAPVVDILALADDDGSTLSLLAVNRHATEGVDAQFQLAGFPPAGTAQWQWLTGPDVLAANSLEEPDRVRVRQKEIRLEGRRFHLELPARSVSVILVRSTRR